MTVAQQFGSSVVGTEFDFITETDPSTFDELTYIGKGRQEMPDKRDDDAGLFKQAYSFEASFQDQTRVKLHIDADIGSREAARKEASRYVVRLGRLPTALRSGVKRLVVHQGGRDTTAFSDIGLIVVYSDNATDRIRTHDLEETLFHESVHAAWDQTHAHSPGWRRAQRSDPGFATMYAKRKPDREDLAETALFAFAMLHYQDRLPAETRKRLADQIPARIQYVADLLPPNKPLHYDVKSQPAK
jgi:hypothetical protein